MKLFRFISNNEYARLMAGETIVNTTDYSEKYDTNSKGFCFFAYNRTNNIDLIISNVLDEWGLAGIVNDSYLVEIEVPAARKAWGWYSGGKKTEYNLTQYSEKNILHVYKVAKRNPADYQETSSGAWITYKGNKIF